MSLALSNEDITTFMVFKFGNMKLKDYIKEQYSGYVTCLIEYLLLIGDFESVISCCQALRKILLLQKLKKLNRVLAL
jgi:hypothetical protein